MKKIFFFFGLLIIGINVQAETLKNFEVLNGKLSIPFDSKLNNYTVYLVNSDENILANYTLIDEDNEVEVIEDKDKAIYQVKKDNNVLEEYTFYKIREESSLVFNEIPTVKQERIANLHIYVTGVCALIIIILFKIIVLGFKKKK